MIPKSVLLGIFFSLSYRALLVGFTPLSSAVLSRKEGELSSTIYEIMLPITNWTRYVFEAGCPKRLGPFGAPNALRS